MTHDHFADFLAFDRIREPAHGDKRWTRLTPTEGFVRCKPPARCVECGGRFDNLHAELRTCLGCTPDEPVTKAGT